MATFGGSFICAYDLYVALVCENDLEDGLCQKLSHIAVHFLFNEDGAGEAARSSICILLSENSLDVCVLMEL